MHGLLSLLAPWLWIHQLWLGRMLQLSHFLADAGVPLVLALQKGLLGSQELFFRPRLLALLPVNQGRKAALLLLRGVSLLQAFFFQLSDSSLLPSLKSLDVFQVGLRVLDPLLRVATNFRVSHPQMGDITTYLVVQLSEFVFGHGDLTFTCAVGRFGRHVFNKLFSRKGKSGETPLRA